MALALRAYCKTRKGISMCFKQALLLGVGIQNGDLGVRLGIHMYRTCENIVLSCSVVSDSLRPHENVSQHLMSFNDQETTT